MSTVSVATVYIVFFVLLFVLGVGYILYRLKCKPVDPFVSEAELAPAGVSQYQESSNVGDSTIVLEPNNNNNNTATDTTCEQSSSPTTIRPDRSVSIKLESPPKPSCLKRDCAVQIFSTVLFSHVVSVEPADNIISKSKPTTSSVSSMTIGLELITSLPLPIASFAPKVIIKEPHRPSSLQPPPLIITDVTQKPPVIPLLQVSPSPARARTPSPLRVPSEPHRRTVVGGFRVPSPLPKPTQEKVDEVVENKFYHFPHQNSDAAAAGDDDDSPPSNDDDDESHDSSVESLENVQGNSPSQSKSWTGLPFSQSRERTYDRVPTNDEGDDDSDDSASPPMTSPFASSGVPMKLL